MKWKRKEKKNKIAENNSIRKRNIKRKWKRDQLECNQSKEITGKDVHGEEGMHRRQKGE